MSANSYSFKVGAVNCTVLLDGATVIGKAGILKRYPDATEDDYIRAFADIGLSIDDAQSSLNVFAARIGHETVLVDAGEAGKPRGGAVLESMKMAGIRPDEITLVIITHAHGDHVQGLLSAENEPVYPNATYIISKPEMAYWQGRIDNGTVDHAAIVSMMREKGLRLIEMDEQIMPGVTAVPIPGHTPGQIGVLFESENEKLAVLADMLHSPMQFVHPQWSPSFDIDTGQSVPTRCDTLGRIADENLLAQFYHLPFPGLGRVKRTETGFIWNPVG